MNTRYRNKTAEIDAVQWTGHNADELSAFCSPFDFQLIDPEDRVEDPDETAAVRESEHGTWRGLTPGDWVVRRGEDLFECSAADFAKLYEPVPDVAPPVDRAAVLREAADEIGPLRKEHATWRKLGQQNLKRAHEENARLRAEQAATLERIREAIRRLAAHAVGFQDVLDDSDRGAWGKTIAADIAELRRMADEAQPDRASTSPTAVYLATPCDACRHTLNWHRNDIGCTVPSCVCGRFQPPAEAQQDGAQP
ncbi:hypothetical protein H1V43_32345 [Streptomyces sp. PSKA54]|uniref:Uncharacterized protein n=1 Tax=Streptomyces himalayensis subsp. aureolus TaxID=2758039 RepID=A0A7W2D718_9ACTN|nr:cell division protein ZapB [Streptomyces himalayensis]MBA4865955.1 hypothetical protein [Streptomyces himalayensis subsp. aureolus]